MSEFLKCVVADSLMELRIVQSPYLMKLVVIMLYHSLIKNEP